MTATLHVIFGPSGAGKTTYANSFARREKAVAFILDEWMARLFAPDMPEPIEYEWMIERVQRCEAQIWSVAAGVLATGRPVILDIGLMRKADRARVAERNQVRGENFAIEVLPEHFDFIEGVFEAPDANELKGAIVSESN